MHWKTNRLKDLRHDYLNELFPIYGKEESHAIFSLLLKRYFKISKTDLAVDPDIRLSESEILRLHFAVKDLLNHKPLQYILKYVDFLNLRLMVNESVLIPRPETEEMVQFVIKEEKALSGLRIVDIGTGSGCIAIALAKNLSESFVAGIDVSPQAIKTARKNSFANEIMVHFKEMDILVPDSYAALEEYDVIVSNPPYVTESDKLRMHKNVLNFEPHLALFVSDEKPLLFYEAILYFADEKLRSGGRIYLEINERYGNEVVVLLRKNGFEKVALHKDISEKDRFVSGLKT